MPETRRLDGQPETDADRRFFDLRAAGYTGPIDPDGYPDLTSDAAVIAQAIWPQDTDDVA